MDFNLVEEKWIPILRQDGQFMRVGIRQALIDAHSIRQLAASNPMDRAAALRFLLAVLYWCKGNPPPEEKAQCANGVPEAWLTKLDEHREWFNLLGDGPLRFLQYEKSSEPDNKPAAFLIHEVPTGVNPWHFRHATDPPKTKRPDLSSASGLCRACCALGLIRYSMFAYNHGAGKCAGLNSTPPVYAIPVGASLAETLIMSWTPCVPNQQLGSPAWENPKSCPPRTGNVPLLQGLTWIPRQAWLGEPIETTERCILCGSPHDDGLLIKTMQFSGYGKRDQFSSEWKDPYCIYRRTKNTKKGKNEEEEKERPLCSVDALTAFNTHDPDVIRGGNGSHAVQWARLLARLECQQHPVWLAALASDGQAKLYDTFEAKLEPSPVTENAETTNTTAENWHSSSKALLREAWEAVQPRDSKTHKVLRHFKEDKCHDVIALLENIKPQAEHTLSRHAERLAAAPPEAWRDAAAEAYAPLMKAAAESLAPGASVQALQRRRKLAALAPAPQESPPAKPGKGEMKIKIKPAEGGQP